MGGWVVWLHETSSKELQTYRGNSGNPSSGEAGEGSSYKNHDPEPVWRRHKVRRSYECPGNNVDDSRGDHCLNQTEDSNSQRAQDSAKHGTGWGKRAYERLIDAVVKALRPQSEVGSAAEVV